MFKLVASVPEVVLPRGYVSALMSALEGMDWDRFSSVMGSRSSGKEFFYTLFLSFNHHQNFGFNEFQELFLHRMGFGAIQAELNYSVKNKASQQGYFELIGQGAADILEGDFKALARTIYDVAESGKSRIFLGSNHTEGHVFPRILCVSKGQLTELCLNYDLSGNCFVRSYGAVSKLGGLARVLAQDNAHHSRWVRFDGGIPAQIFSNCVSWTLTLSLLYGRVLSQHPSRYTVKSWVESSDFLKRLHSAQRTLTMSVRRVYTGLAVVAFQRGWLDQQSMRRAMKNAVQIHPWIHVDKLFVPNVMHVDTMRLPDAVSVRLKRDILLMRSLGYSGSGDSFQRWIKSWVKKLRPPFNLPPALFHETVLNTIVEVAIWEGSDFSALVKKALVEDRSEAVLSVMWSMVQQRNFNKFFLKGIPLDTYELHVMVWAVSLDEDRPSLEVGLCDAMSTYPGDDVFCGVEKLCAYSHLICTQELKQAISGYILDRLFVFDDPISGQYIRCLQLHFKWFPFPGSLTEDDFKHLFQELVGYLQKPCTGYYDKKNVAQLCHQVVMACRNAFPEILTFARPCLKLLASAGCPSLTLVFPPQKKEKGCL